MATTILDQHTLGVPFDGTRHNDNLESVENSLKDLGPLIVTGLTPTAGTGLSVNVSAGTADIGGQVVKAATFVISGLVAATTNHLYLLNTGAGASNTTGSAPANSVKLGTAVTGASTVTSVQTTWASGRQFKRRTEELVHGGGAGQPRAVDLASWHATNNEGNEVKGSLAAGAISGGVGDTNTYAAFGSRPSAGNAGNTHWNNDGFTLDIDTGGVWAPFGPVFPFSLGVGTGDFSVVNGGSSSFTSEKDSLLLTAPGAGSGTSANVYVKTPALAGSDYTLTCYFLHDVLTNKQYPKFGLLFRDSGTGRMVTFHFTEGIMYLTKWTTATAVSADYSNRPLTTAAGWLRIRDDQADLIFYISGDGRNWLEIDRRARTNWLANPDQIGLFVEPQNLGSPNYGVQARLLHWREQ